MLCHNMLHVAHRSTYYTSEEEEALEAIAENQDESFSGVVREAIRNYWGIQNE